VGWRKIGRSACSQLRSVASWSDPNVESSASSWTPTFLIDMAVETQRWSRNIQSMTYAKHHNHCLLRGHASVPGLPFGQEWVCPSPRRNSDLQIKSSVIGWEFHPRVRPPILSSVIRHLPLRTRARSCAKPYSPETGHLACSSTRTVYYHARPKPAIWTGRSLAPASFRIRQSRFRLTHTRHPLPLYHGATASRVLVGLRYERAAKPARYGPGSYFPVALCSPTPTLGQERP